MLFTVIASTYSAHLMKIEPSADILTLHASHNSHGLDSALTSTSSALKPITVKALRTTFQSLRSLMELTLGQLPCGKKKKHKKTSTTSSTFSELIIYHLACGFIPLQHYDHVHKVIGHVVMCKLPFTGEVNA